MLVFFLSFIGSVGSPSVISFCILSLLLWFGKNTSNILRPA
jgi:hypothetical protein